MNFPALIKEQLAGRRVRKAVLYEADFASGFFRASTADTHLKTLDGKEWLPGGNVIQVDNISQAINGDAPSQRVSLSGVDPTLIAKAKASESEYYLRPFRIFWQFFTLDTWQVLDYPFAIDLRLMTSFDMEFDGTGEAGPSYQIGLINETPFLTPALPPHGFLTDRDQQTLYPGDRGMERVATVDQKQISFPD